MSGNVGAQLERLVGIMARLRAEGGCPWDREQDLRSLRPYLIEEAFEVLDEMDRVSYGGPWRPLCEELGDLLFQIVFHAQLANEVGEFSMAEVCQAISDKIESRHPHVFGEARVTGGAEEVLDNWARLKAEEKKRKHGSEGSVLDGVPTAAPALLRAERLTEKASRIGFDWPELQGVRAKVDEELGELDEAIASGDRDALEHELGDVLFSLANVARFIKTPPEDALRQANRRFTDRFHRMEAVLRERGVPFGGASLEELDALWNEAKKAEKLAPPVRELPRAVVHKVRVPVADLAAQRALWDALAPKLGWQRTARGDQEVSYSEGLLAFVFFEADGAARPGGEFELEAPSQTAIGALATFLEAQGVPVDRAEHGLSFQDPAGLRWHYGIPR